VVIVRVQRNGLAGQAGLRRGMVVTKVDKKAVSSAKELSERLTAAAVQKGVLLQLETPEGGTSYVLLKAGAGTPSPAAGPPRWEGEQARMSDNEQPDWRIPHGQSGSESQKETGESHRLRSTHRGVAEGAARNWLSSWPPATVGTGISSSHWSVLACDSIARSRAPPRQSGEVPSSRRSVLARLRLLGGTHGLTPRLGSLGHKPL
jgi:hypothetical protein